SSPVFTSLRRLPSSPTRRSSDLRAPRGPLLFSAVPRGEPPRTRGRSRLLSRLRAALSRRARGPGGVHGRHAALRVRYGVPSAHSDRKSTRLNSSHVKISYAVFCL